MDYPFWHRNADGTHQLTMCGLTHAQIRDRAAAEGASPYSLDTLLEIGSLAAVGPSISPIERVAAKALASIIRGPTDE
jgi:hypothetical protein